MKFPDKMDYLEWSKEYTATANEINAVINRLKNMKKSASRSEKNKLDLKITQYKTYYNDCISTANHLMLRHEGIE